MKIKSNGFQRFILFLLVIAGIYACNSKMNPSEFDLYRADMRNRKSLTYTADIKRWSSTQPDTFSYKTFVVLSKVPGDTVIGGKIFVQDSYNDLYYDGNDVYWHEKDTPYIQKRLVSENGIGYVHGTSVGKGILFDFIDTSLWIFKDTGYSSTSTLDNHILTLTLFSKDTSGGIESHITFTFKENETFPTKIHWFRKGQGVESHRELTFKNVAYDVDMDKYAKPWLAKGYPVMLTHPVQRAPLRLPDGAKPGPIVGTNVQTGKPFTQAELTGKVVLVDFWFLGCTGCMEAIPSLKNLRKKYPASKVAIVSIDPFDNGADGIKKFVDEKAINYTVVCAPKSILSNYLASFFPTFYILDKNGAVVFSETGFHKEGFEEKVSKIVDSHL